MTSQRPNTRWEVLLERIERDPEQLPLLRANAADPKKDEKGFCSGVLALTLRGHGIHMYVVRSDKRAFHSLVHESVEIRLSLFERAKRGEPIDNSYLAMLAYKDLFDALAIGEMHLARKLAGHMGGRDELERSHDHPFDRALGYCLRSFVLGDSDQMRRRLEDFRKQCETKCGRDFRGYATVFRAILHRDSATANKGFAELLEGHRRQSKGNGVFCLSPDLELCVWGLGMASLARRSGLVIEISDPLIPTELIA